MRKIYLFVLITLLGFSQAWGKTLTGKVAVGQGKGEASVETRSNYFDVLVDGPVSTTNGTQVTATASNSAVSWAYCKFSATAATGYSFEGWYTNAACTNGKQTDNPYQTASAKNVDRTDEYWAKFTPIHYTIAFNGNGAESGSTASISAEYDQAVSLNTNGFSKVAYTVSFVSEGGTIDPIPAYAIFDSWNTKANGTGTRYAETASVSNLASTEGATATLYAQWNGATKITLPSAGTNGTSLFDGWYDGETLIGYAGDAFTPTTNVTLTAHWTAVATPVFAIDDAVIELEQSTRLALTNVSNPSIVITPEGIVSYDATTGSLTGVGVGVATIAINQEATANINAKYEELTITVTKKASSLAVLLNDVEGTEFILNPTLSATLGFNKVSDAEVELSAVSGEELVAIEEGVVTALLNEGTAVFSATLAETETYQSASVEFSIQIARAAEAADCYLLENQSDDQSVWHGNTCHEHTWAEENAAGVVRFQIHYTTASIDPGYKVQQLLNGEWVDATSKMTDFSTSFTWKEFTLNQAAKGVRIWGSGSLYNHVKNLSVTRKGSIRVQNIALEAEKDHACEGTLNVNYSIANGGDLKIVCNNEKFVLDSYVIENVDCRGGVANISVSYPSDVEIEDTANVVIYNAVYRAEVLLTAKIIPSKNTYADYTAYFCQGESVEFEGVVYSEATTTQVLLAEKNIMGGDSIVNLTVIELVPDTTVLNETMYLGDILIVDPNEWALLIDEIEYQFEEAEYPLDAEVPVDLIQHTQSVNGCDSTIIRHIEVVDPLTTGINSVETNPVVQATKELRDGVIYIRRGESLYLIDGKRVK